MISSKLSQPNYANFLDRIQHAKKMAGNAKPLQPELRAGLTLDRSDGIKDVKKPAARVVTPTITTMPLPTNTIRPTEPVPYQKREVVSAQTIDNLFAKIESMLGQMRELAAKADNASLSDDDRIKMYDQFNALRREFYNLPSQTPGLPTGAQNALARFVNPEMFNLSRGIAGNELSTPQNAQRVMQNIDHHLAHLDNIGRTLVGAYLGNGGYRAGKVDVSA